MKIALAAFTPGGRMLLDGVLEVLSRAELLPRNPFASDSAFGEASSHKGGSGTRPREANELSVFDKSSENIHVWLAREFKASDALIFIGATGLVVRLLCGLIESKDRDPAVLVLDEKGRFVIPLLSGHIGGANRLAGYLAARLGAQAVITTATDLNGIFAIDEWAAQNGCIIPDISRIKHVSGALLEGKKAGFISNFPVEGDLPEGFELAGSSSGTAEFLTGVYVSLSEGKDPFDVTLHLLPRIAVLGAGCKKHTDPEAFERFVLDTLARHNISPRVLTCLASIDLKQTEPCMLDFAAKYDLDFKVFDAESLNRVPGEFQASSFVKERTGVDNVCERAPVAAGGGHLLIRKTSSNGMTLALGIPGWVCKFS